MSVSDLDPFWVEARAACLAKGSTHADPSACGTCRGLAEDGKPVEHEGCAQRATLLQAPDHPDYEILAGFSLEENAKLPARFHVPVFDDCGKPNLWLCAVCWEEGQVVGWPCATATKYGTQVFTPQHEAETVQKKQAAELDAFRALELGEPDGRVSASCGDPAHPTWLRAPNDNRSCPWCRIAEVRAEALAEAKAEVVDWLVKKAHEGTEVTRLADKVERGAIRIFFDAERSAAAVATLHYDKVPDPLDGCHWCACGNRWPCKQSEVAA
ncbi:hypothetical protein ACH4MG_27540 [Streptomyces sp. NPDC017454]|uniref:hypothetical protein n=1 Tax=Streptomyces sp. NPDC017454 TaxID=3364997 RepID=UPI00379DC2D4